MPLIHGAEFWEPPRGGLSLSERSFCGCPLLTLSGHWEPLGWTTVQYPPPAHLQIMTVIRPLDRSGGENAGAFCAANGHRDLHPSYLRDCGARCFPSGVAWLFGWNRG